jgi:succinyl-diaminopimelate desuccinylase
MTTDPVPLLQSLIRCRSVTPEEGGALAFVAETLKACGFETHRLRFQEPGTAEVDNLFARYGHGEPHFCFAGHTDVVPVGEAASWRHPPFGGEIAEGKVFGRGACDMKGSIAGFMAAAIDFIEERGPGFEGSVSLLLTGDEEGAAVNGTVKVLRWLKEKNAIPDHCLVGEPTCPEKLGDTLKIGRRGSLRVALTSKGRQGHSAYPHLALNPLPPLVRLLDRLNSHSLDEGTDHFDPSHLTITSIDVGNPASNVIPEKAEARFNIRFNPLHTVVSLMRWIEDEVRRVETEMGGKIEVAFGGVSEAFLTEPGEFVAKVRQAIAGTSGILPELSTSGGTSDARFIKDYCPVVDFGPLNTTIHQVDEHIAISELRALKDIYQAVLEHYFGPA